MRILSPYGKDPARELRTVYGFSSAQTAAQFILWHVQEAYDFQHVTLETLHVAYGLTTKLVADEEQYYLKFASRSMHARPEQLFPWLAYVRQHRLPVPEIIRSRDNHWFLSPLPTSDYDVVYLMRALSGTTMRTASYRTIQEYATVMAAFHRLGSQYSHSVVGSLATWNSKWAQREQLWRDLHVAPFVSQALVTRAMHLVEQAGPGTLSATILHGDFRLCHVLFEHEQLTGIIDVDQSTYGERWVDVCYGFLSGADPERGSLFDFAALQTALHTYHHLFPFTDDDRAALKATFAYATLETLRDLLPGVIAGTASAHDIEVTQQLFATILAASEDELLGTP
jgi:Ser/Thr protein kinase RdoA (MazF antagonist)